MPYRLGSFFGMLALVAAGALALAVRSLRRAGRVLWRSRLLRTTAAGLAGLVGLASCGFRSRSSGGGDHGGRRSGLAGGEGRSPNPSRAPRGQALGAWRKAPAVFSAAERFLSERSRRKVRHLRAWSKVAETYERARRLAVGSPVPLDWREKQRLLGDLRAAADTVRVLAQGGYVTQEEAGRILEKLGEFHEFVARYRVRRRYMCYLMNFTPAKTPAELRAKLEKRLALLKELARSSAGVLAGVKFIR